MRVALGLEYDGAGFCGWQTQAEGCSVQDALETGLSEIAGHQISTVCAGRTDAGVHALGQVVHFDTETERPLSAWTRGVNAFVSSGVSVLWARSVDEAFHARFSAEAKFLPPGFPFLFGSSCFWALRGHMRAFWRH